MAEQLEDIHALFASVAAYIASAEEKLSEGQYVELADLGPLVDDLCTRVLTLPRPIGDDFQEALDELSLSLNHLKGGMEAARKQLAGEAKSLQKRQKALKLYSTRPKEE